MLNIVLKNLIKYFHFLMSDKVIKYLVLKISKKKLIDLKLLLQLVVL